MHLLLGPGDFRKEISDGIIPTSRIQTTGTMEECEGVARFFGGSWTVMDLTKEDGAAYCFHI